MPTYALRDVDPVALTICKQGANRQRIFLRKSTAVADLLALPTRSSIFKEGDEWSVFYCVVAEPGAREDPGMVGEEGSEDVWADEQEIRKAAHRLMLNKGYVNAMHDALEEQGCSIVENAVALADFEVGGATIKKGSWYVGIEPSPDFRALVDAGEITGVSMEGTGLRELIEKAGDPKGAQGAKAKKCPSCGGTVSAGRSTCQNCSHSFKKQVAEDGAALMKSTLDFSTRVAAADLREEMWRAWDALQGVIYEAYQDDSGDDPAVVVRRSIEQFSTYLSAKLGEVTQSPLAKGVGSVDRQNADEEADVGLAEDLADLKKTTDTRLDDLKKDVSGTNEAVAGLVTVTTKLLERIDGGEKTKVKKEEVDEPSDLKGVVSAIGKFADRMDEQDAALTGIAKAVRELGSGDSSQKDRDDIAKTNGKDPLAGLLD